MYETQFTRVLHANFANEDELVSRSIAKTGVNISHILLRLKDRENAEK